MQIELRCNTLVQDFYKYKEDGMLGATVRMNEKTLLRFTQQLSRKNKWSENSLTPEQVTQSIMMGAEMNIDGVYIRYSGSVSDNYMRI